MGSATFSIKSGEVSLETPSSGGGAGCGNPYETDRLLHEYLLFHYGAPDEVLPYPDGPVSALDFPVRCVREAVQAVHIPAGARALDLGCAVGRATFELARICDAVVGVDYSHRFVGAAEQIRTEGEAGYLRAEEGERCTPLVARRPEGVEVSRVRFEQGDAMELRADLGSFDVVLMANLIDRLRHPLRCLERLPALVCPGGLLVVTSPYTWLPEYTARAEWLGGVPGADGGCLTTLEGLQLALSPAFTLLQTMDLPFLIREHARKYQWSVAQASLWRRIV